jgi:4a-hydroxytetrahydrobiopterin dehydratase
MAQFPIHHSRTALPLDEVLKALKDRAPWTYLNGAIELRLEDLPFSEVCRLVTAINELAGSLDHHPDVSYGYQHLTIRFQTHDVGGISSLDLACADHILTLLA